MDVSTCIDNGMDILEEWTIFLQLDNNFPPRATMLVKTFHPSELKYHNIGMLLMVGLNPQ